MKNKNQEENWEKKLTQFLLSEEILFENEIGEGWIKISEGKQLTSEYQKIINKVAQLLKSEKEKLLERIEKIKPPVMKEEYFRELPSLKGIWYAGFSAGKKIILEKLKEEIKKEL